MKAYAETRLSKSANIVYRNIKYKTLLGFTNQVLDVYFSSDPDSWEIQICTIDLSVILLALVKTGQL